jgi:hypothetical protein
MRFSSDFVLYGLGDERARHDCVAVATLAAVIAASPIVVTVDSTATTTSECDFPAGFDAIDIVILDWIVAEDRRDICRGLPM